MLPTLMVIGRLTRDWVGEPPNSSGGVLMLDPPNN
jgi:hypothetical protein